MKTQLEERIAAGLPDPRETADSINRQATNLQRLLNGTQPDPQVAALVSAAAEATEHFTDDELEAYASTRRPETGFISADGATMIDTINPATGRSVCYGKTLEDVQREWPGAFIQSMADYCTAKAEKQNSLISWTETTREKYWEMLEVLPPAAMGKGGFLVGEPWDHHAITGQPRFAGFREWQGKFYEANRPMTRTEYFAEMLNSDKLASA